MSDKETNSMKLSKEDIEFRQQYLRTQAQKRLDAKKKAETAKEASSETNYLGLVALFLGAFSLGFAGYIFVLLQESQSEVTFLQNQIELKSKQLTKLESQLSATGEDADVSVNALRARLNSQSADIKSLMSATKKNSSVLASLPNVDALLKEQAGKVSSSTGSKIANLERDLKAMIDSSNERIVQLESEMGLALQTEINKNSIESLKQEMDDLGKNVEVFSQTYSSKQMTNMKLEIEDIQIRLDRIQNALSSPAL